MAVINPTFAAAPAPTYVQFSGAAKGGMDARF